MLDVQIAASGVDGERERGRARGRDALHRRTSQTLFLEGCRTTAAPVQLLLCSCSRARRFSSLSTQAHHSSFVIRRTSNLFVRPMTPFQVPWYLKRLCVFLKGLRYNKGTT